MKKENIALGIFLVFIVGAGVYFYSLETVPQNVADTNPVVQREAKKVVVNPPILTLSTELWKSDLVTCRGEKYGYEFQYPKEWYLTGLKTDHFYPKKLSSCDETVHASLSPMSEDEMQKTQKYIGINFSVHTEKDFPTLDMQGVHTIDELREKAKKSRFNFYTEETLIDGERAVRQDFSENKNIPSDKTTRSLVFFTTATISAFILKKSRLRFKNRSLSILSFLIKTTQKPSRHLSGGWWLFFTTHTKNKLWT